MEYVRKTMVVKKFSLELHELQSIFVRNKKLSSGCKYNINEIDKEGDDLQKNIKTNAI